MAPHLLLEEAVAHADAGFVGELLAILDFGIAHSVVHLFEAQHTEGNVTCFVAHHVTQQLLKQRLVGQLVQVAESGEGKTLNHDLHTEVGEVPTRILDDVIEQHLEVRVDWVAATEFFVEVATEHLDVTCFVHHLRAGVQLGVVPRHGLDDFGCADERTLLAMEELRQRPLAALDTELEPLLVAPLGEWCVGVPVGVDAVADERLVFGHGLLDVDVEVPWQVGGAVPLTGLGLFIQLAQLRARQRVIPREDRIGVVLHDVLDLIRVDQRCRKNRVNVVD